MTDVFYKNFLNYSMSKRNNLLNKLNSMDTNEEDSKKISKMNDIHRNNMHFHTIRNISLLTIINLIGLPLTIIVGYFGMGFKGMYGKNNVLSVKNPNLFVILLGVVCSSIVLYFYYKEYKNFDLDKDYI